MCRGEDGKGYRRPALQSAGVGLRENNLDGAEFFAGGWVGTPTV